MISNDSDVEEKTTKKSRKTEMRVGEIDSQEQGSDSLSNLKEFDGSRPTSSTNKYYFFLVLPSNFFFNVVEYEFKKNKNSLANKNNE